ncbi:MAG TPA: L,D-transpeptidase family protein [Anaerolineales bacterium]|nr:L,D-transpeptidase family protein [Anaerolineales bacterium]HMX76496.1 L,D-transpeptidase family protein [Anaerolineales bacterium]HNA55984.1 L,D-transpeptidase family protein [Anaerolineales bacterium]HNC89916.1 L,D-transpeptidase family protein [Anaerolineales bacterium]HNE70066.1 L,D-transpeptidase family protein [Anaerolineales bacterium]
MNNRLPTNNSNGRPSPEKQNQAKVQKKKRGPLLPILLVLMGCAVFAFAAWSAINSPVLASLLNSAPAPQQAQPVQRPFAQVSISKPSAVVVQQPLIQVAMPTATLPALPVENTAQQPQPQVIDPAPTADLALNAAALPTLQVSVLPGATDAPAVEQQPAAEQAPVVQEANSQPGVISAEIVVDTPTPEYVAPTEVAAAPVPVGVDTGGEHWIDVDLSQQRVYAYAGDTVVNSFVVSTGTWQTPTVTGKYKVWVKLRSAAMSGPGYYLPDVPYIMYFYGSYGLHGTYWHNNFGTPMSHGCVNLTIPDAEWLYNFSSVGTVVNVHY